MKTKYWLALLAATAFICGLLSVALLQDDTGATHARISSSGTVLKTVDLRINQTFTVTLEDGSFNVITVRDGKIAVTEASCPDQYCIRRGFCSGGTQIVCLPNTLVIDFLEASDVDFMVG